MPLITAERTAHYRKLADDADAALGRGDDMGVELLRSLVPEITDAVEEINDGLRESVSLLFEGLRDEALGLHDASLPEAALRLHLADKPQWPDMALRFQAAEIALPPAIDFEALTAVNAAYAEVEQLRNPLDALRRLVLDRAPLADRIQALREIQKLDSSRPTWAEQLAPLEQARITELAPEIAAAVKGGDAKALAALEAEIMNPAWITAVPVRLAQQAQGANSWLQLRRGLPVIEDLAASIEREFEPIPAGEDAFDDSGRLDRLRDARNRWQALETKCREIVFAMPQYPVVGKLAQPENLGLRLEMARAQVEPALNWMAAIDAHEHVLETFQQLCDDLHKLAAELPMAGGAKAWLGRVEQAVESIRKTQTLVPGLAVPSALEAALGAAKLEVASRIARQRWAVVAVSAAAITAPFLLALLMWWASRE